MKRCLLSLSKEIRAVIKDNGLILAGGFIRAIIAGEEVQDIDLFGPTVEVLEKSANQIAAIFPGSTVLNTRNAITIYGGQGQKHTIQLITRWLYSYASQCMKSFDYSICGAAIQHVPDYREWRSVAHDRFYADLAAKRLYYTRPVRDEDAGGSVLRAFKYSRRGYHISPESLSAVLMRLHSGIDKDAWNNADKDEQEKLIRDKLREVDPSVRMDGIIDTDEHELDLLD